MRSRPLTMSAPSVFERALRYVAPQAAMARYHSRLKFEISAQLAARSAPYRGAIRRRATSSWNPDAGSADADTLWSLPELRARSRDLRRNNAVASGALQIWVDFVVGRGLALQAAMNRQVLRDRVGLTDEQITELEKRCEAHWHGWAATTDCDAGRQYKMPELERLAYESRLESGDVFFLHRYTDEVGTASPLRVQLFEADRVSNPNGMVDNEEIAGGIKADPMTGKPIEYYITNRHPGDFRSTALVWQPVPAFGEKSGIKLVHHVMRPLRPGQRRGVPILAPVMDEIKLLGDYMDAEQQAAKIAASLSLFVTSPTGAAGEAPMQASEQDVEPDQNWEIGAGTIMSLAEGEGVEVVDPSRPNPGLGDYLAATEQHIASGLNMSASVLRRKFDSSFSASRGEIAVMYLAVMSERSSFAGQFNQANYEARTAEGVMTGRLDMPGFGDPEIKAAYLGADWIGPPMPQLDPIKEVDAALKRIDGVLSDRTYETAQLTGRSFERVAERRRREEELLDGLKPSAPTTALPAPGEEPDEEPDEDENDDEDNEQ